MVNNLLFRIHETLPLSLFVIILFHKLHSRNPFEFQPIQYIGIMSRKFGVNRMRLLDSKIPHWNNLTSCWSEIMTLN